MVPKCRIFGSFLGPAFPASRMQHVSDLHPKFSLRPHHVWIQSPSTEIRRGKKRRNHRAKI